MTPSSRPDTVDVPRALTPAVPVFAAPMAGGPSTPELVAAVVRAGGGGFLAGGMKTAEQVRAQVDGLRALLRSEGQGHDAGPSPAPVSPTPVATASAKSPVSRTTVHDTPPVSRTTTGEGTSTSTTTTWGVNLFVPDAVNTALRPEQLTAEARAARRDAVAAFRARLAPLAADLGVELAGVDEATPDPAAERAAFEDMLTAAQEQRWPLVSFTFGLPAPAVFARLAAAGVPAGVTVTDAAEARAAVGNGAVFLVVQGPQAGGHRGTLDPQASPGTSDLPTLLSDVGHAVGTQVPLVAAGGAATREHVVRLLETGATAVAAGSAFLRTPEAGTSPIHRTALDQLAAGAAFAHPGDGIVRTALTRAFTGRWARSLVTPFMDEFADAPAAYPEVNALTQPLRAAAGTRGDLERVHLWAGAQAHRAQAGSAAEVLSRLAP